MRIEPRSMPYGMVLSVTGRLDAATTPEFEERCGQLLAGDVALAVLDFQGLQYISSAGLRAVLSLDRELRKREGRLALCGLTGMVEEVITLTGLQEAMTIYDSFDDIEQG
jgi:anti-anti-sigma factor